MTLGASTFPQDCEDRRVQLQQPELIGHSGLALTQTPGGLILGDVIGVNEFTQGESLLPKIQVTPLEILHQGQQGGGLTVCLDG